MSVPRIPPRRVGVDLSHIGLNPDGSRYADIASLKKRPNVQSELEEIRKRVRIAKQRTTLREQTAQG